jgi:hypothetical protein
VLCIAAGYLPLVHPSAEQDEMARINQPMTALKTRTSL